MSFSGTKPATTRLTGLQPYEGGAGPDTKTGDSPAEKLDKTAINVGVFDEAIDAALSTLGVAQGATDTGLSGLAHIPDNATVAQALTALDSATAPQSAPMQTTPLTVATDGQTILHLPQAPTEPATVSLTINGIVYHAPSYLSVSGSSLTWLNTDFILETTDQIFANWR